MKLIVAVDNSWGIGGKKMSRQLKQQFHYSQIMLNGMIIKPLKENYMNQQKKRDNYMNIIFLDIDGVLNSQAYLESKRNNKGFYELSTFHLQKLAKLYHSCNALIVLTSTWRQLEKEDIYQYLIDSLAKYDMYIISKTPIINISS